MQIIELKLSHYNMYSPANGELIANEILEINEDAKSLVAYWTNETINDPFIKDMDLAVFWQLLLDEKDPEYYTEYYEALDTFLKEYECRTWVVFKITSGIEVFGPGEETVWFVIDMEAV